MTKTPQVGRPEKRGVNRWFVPSGSAGVGYTVEQVDGLNPTRMSPGAIRDYGALKPEK